MTEDRSALELARRLLDETREELARADGKASLLLAAVGVIIGAVVTGILTTTTTPLHLHHTLRWIFWAGAAAAGLGVACLGDAVWPRVGRAEQGRVSYFADVLQYGGDPAGLRAALSDASGDPLDREVNQILTLAGIVARKYRALRRGMGLTALGAASCLAAWIAAGVS